MKKRMFIVMEVKSIKGNDDFVVPLDADGREVISKSRVIYVDAMRQGEKGTTKWFAFDGVPSTPEPQDEWEEWVNEVGIVLSPIDAVSRACIRNLFRKMPRG